ncbi:MAG: GNAT family N-acetyltransferase [Thermoanaerobaculia bacterium]|nr:GNAT family N-acetyltransferase [Thermoanaerobaculia bacterium]
MALRDELTVRKVEDAGGYRAALDVLGTVYLGEKGWGTPEQLFPESDLSSAAMSWFLAERDGIPVGVTRVLYEIPFDLYTAYEFELEIPGLDVEAFIRANRIAEVGRFAVIPEYRKQILVAAILMRAAATETVERGFSHFITDVFESDPNSPFEFHRRILGFEIVASHDHGELKIDSKRITMLLDLKAAYQRMSRRKSWIFRYITDGWNEALIDRLSTKPPAAPAPLVTV